MTAEVFVPIRIMTSKCTIGAISIFLLLHLHQGRGGEGRGGGRGGEGRGGDEGRGEDEGTRGGEEARV